MSPPLVVSQAEAATAVRLFTEAVAHVADAPRPRTSARSRTRRAPGWPRRGVGASRLTVRAGATAARIDTTAITRAARRRRAADVASPATIGCREPAPRRRAPASPAPPSIGAESARPCRPTATVADARRRRCGRHRPRPTSGGRSATRSRSLRRRAPAGAVAPSPDALAALADAIAGDDDDPTVQLRRRRPTRPSRPSRAAIEAGAGAIAVVPVALAVDAADGHASRDPAWCGSTRAWTSSRREHPDVEIQYLGPPFHHAPALESAIAALRPADSEEPALLAGAVDAGVRRRPRAVRPVHERAPGRRPGRHAPRAARQRGPGSSLQDRRAVRRARARDQRPRHRPLGEEAMAAWEPEAFYLPGVNTQPLDDEAPDIADPRLERARARGPGGRRPAGRAAGDGPLVPRPAVRAAGDAVRRPRRLTPDPEPHVPDGGPLRLVSYNIRFGGGRRRRVDRRACSPRWARRRAAPGGDGPDRRGPDRPRGRPRRTSSGSPAGAWRR